MTYPPAGIGLGLSPMGIRNVDERDTGRKCNGMNGRELVLIYRRRYERTQRNGHSICGRVRNMFRGRRSVGTVRTLNVEHELALRLVQMLEVKHRLHSSHLIVVEGRDYKDEQRQAPVIYKGPRDLR